METIRFLKSNSAYARLWLAQAVSLVGDWFTLVAVAVLIARGSRASGLAISTLLIMQMVPAAIVAPASGVLVDRFDRRSLLILSDIARGLLVLLLIPAAYSGRLWPVYVLALLHYSVSTVFEPARSALLPRLVHPEDLVRASMLANVTWSVMAAVGGILGGTILSLVGTAMAFAIDATTFGISAALIVSIHPTGEHPAEHAQVHTVGPAFWDGLRYLADHPPIAASLLIKTINAVGLVDTFMVIYATRVFVVGDGGATSLGLLYASFGLGALVGPVFLNVANDGSVRQMRRLVVAASALVSAGLFLLAGASSLAVAALAIALRGAGGCGNWVYSTVILQRIVPERLRGRVFSIDLAWTHLLAGASALLGGFWADRVNVRLVVLLVAGASVVPSVVWALAVRWMEEREAEAAGLGVHVHTSR